MQKRQVKYKRHRHIHTYLTRAFTHASIRSSGYTYACRPDQREQSKYAVLYGERFIKIAYSIRGRTQQTNFLQTIKQLERRLDTLVYKAGFARTITTAKQMVNHRYVYVNNTVLTLPGMKLQPGDIIHLHISEHTSNEVSSDYVRTPALEVDPLTKRAIYLFHPQQAEYVLPAPT